MKPNDKQIGVIDSIITYLEHLKERDIESAWMVQHQSDGAKEIVQSHFEDDSPKDQAKKYRQLNTAFDKITQILQE